MKVVHVTPHLGGGMGKALSVISKALPRKQVDQKFILLEKPVNKRYLKDIIATGAVVSVAENLEELAQWCSEADIVQFEFVNHPRIFECLARAPFTPMRSVVWCHISGLYKPYIQPELVNQVGRFVFSSKVSHQSHTWTQLGNNQRIKTAVINSGFGFTETTAQPKHKNGDRSVIGYLGTVNFVKMHKSFFKVIDALERDVKAKIWGIPDKGVTKILNQLVAPKRFEFLGETPDPAKALSEVDIFFYPLQRTHYGTGENALIEAMSMGLPVIVLGNPAEVEIVEHLKTGMVAQTMEEALGYLKYLIDNRLMRQHIGNHAANWVRKNRSPQSAADAFMNLWDELLFEAPTQPDFGHAIGRTPIEWYQSTQNLDGALEVTQPEAESPTKGSLKHFEKVFKDDPSFAQLV